MVKSTRYIRSASIGQFRDEWLSAHPEVNFSEIARKAIDREMKRMEKNEC
jgi:hypothetical protein